MLQGVETGLGFVLSSLLTDVVVLLQIFEGVVNLLDKLNAWHSTPGSPGNTELKEMAQIGLRIITGYIQQQHPTVSCNHDIVHQPYMSNTFHQACLSQHKHLQHWILQNCKGLQSLSW